jgi:hypothetical protein
MLTHETSWTYKFRTLSSSSSQYLNPYSPKKTNKSNPCLQHSKIHPMHIHILLVLRFFEAAMAHAQTLRRGPSTRCVFPSAIFP